MSVPVEMAVSGEGERVPPPMFEAHSAGATGWEEEFAALAERNAGFMFRVAHGLLRNPHDAEDAVQEALLKLYRTGGWREIEEERAFLARTVWRTGLDVAARRARHSGVAEAQAVIDGRPSGEVSAESAAIATSERAMLQSLIEGLPPELREPLLLSAVEEMTSREAGAALGIPEATVRTRVARARAELRLRYLAMGVAHRGNGAGR